MAVSFALALAACAPRAVAKTSAGSAGAPEFTEIVRLPGVPFFSNTTDQCGPAALTSVLRYWQKDVTMASVKAEIYTPKIHGTLPMDMKPALTKHGLTGEVISGSFEDIKVEIRRKHPVIAYLDFGTRKHPIGHFLVVTGFDDQRQGLYVHSGSAKDKFASYRRFSRGWKDADHWMLIVAPTEAHAAIEPRSRRAPDLEFRMSAEEHFALGATYERQDLTKEAEAEYHEALAVDKNFEPALMALGNASYGRREYRQAANFYERVLRRNPSNGGANNNLAMVYLTTGEHLKKAEKLAISAMATEYRPFAEDTLAQIRKKMNVERL